MSAFSCCYTLGNVIEWRGRCSVRSLLGGFVGPPHLLDLSGHAFRCAAVVGVQFVDLARRDGLLGIAILTALDLPCLD